MDFYKLLNRKAGKFTLLAVYDPASNKRWDETVKPVDGGEEGELLYKRWVRRRRADVEKLSGGKIGYVHVRANNDASMRVVFEEALGLNLRKDAIVVDTRFNGGGNIHEQLSDFLSGKKYFDVVPHGQYVGSQPFDKWIKPSIVVDGREQLLRCAPVPAGLQSQEHRAAGRDAGAGNRNLRLVGKPDRPDAAFRDSDGMLANPRREVRREQPDGA